MGEMTRVKIDISQGIIELEGNQDFVEKYLTWFEEKMLVKQPFKSPKEVITRQPKTPKTSQEKKTKLPGVQKPESFKIKVEGGPTLKDFFKEKLPNTKPSHPEIIPVIATYVKVHAKMNEISEGNISFAYTAVGISRPKFLRQTIINLKNQKSFFTEGSEDGKWILTELGEDYVMNELPKGTKK